MKSIHAKVLDATHLELHQPLTNPPGGQIEILIPEPRPTKSHAVTGRKLRAREDAWCQTHPEILQAHAGQWVIVEGEEIVAHGGDPVPLVQQARERGIRSPYVFYVDPAGPDVVRIGL